MTFFGGWHPQSIRLAAAFFAATEAPALRVQVSGITIPYQFVLMLPYLATQLVMMLVLRWAWVLASWAGNYDRESRATH